MKEKIKAKAKSIVSVCKRYHAMALCFVFAFMMAVLSYGTCYASGDTPSGGVTSGMTTALTTGFSNVQADVVSIITTALPYALAIMSIVVSIRIGLRFFKTTAK